MPPLPPNREHQILHPAAQRLGLHPFDIPMFRNTVPYNGRGACMRCRWCVGFACEVNARIGHAQHRHPQSAGHRQLRTPDRMHGEGDPDRRPRARARRRLFRCGGRLQEQTADLVIVSLRAPSNRPGCCSTAAASCSRKGWATATTGSGAICKATPTPARSGCSIEDIYDDIGPGAQIAICDYNHGNAGLAGGAMLANEFIRLPYPVHRPGSALRAALGQGA